MFATFDIKNYPTVNVKLGNTIYDQDDFDNFINQWLSLYHFEKDYELIFDTKEVGFINPKYALLMAIFIKKIKREYKNKQYLKHSTIYVYNNYVFNLLKLIFLIENPIAPVKIINYNNNQEITINP
tara:strand:+ start:965 stop:1342 length:378 start_codon:yes stop_codon:yes gene_type:complete